MTLDDRLVRILHECDREPDEITKYVVIDQSDFTKSAKQAILSDLLEIIGEDAEHAKGYTKPAPELGNGYSYYSPSCDAIDGFECNCGASFNNQIRQELRQKVKKYCE